MDKEMQQFQDDLMEAVRDMKAGRAARAHRVPLTPAADARALAIIFSGSVELTN